MEIENIFEVPAPPADVWDFLLDIPRVAPCMPGAELTEVVDETTWKGKVTVKLGAVSLSYRGTVQLSERDDAGRRVLLDAKGTETRGKGTASAKVTSRLEPADEGTRVVIVTDLTLSGAAAQYGRGMIGDVSRKLTAQFADCLKQQLEPVDEGVERAAPPPQKVKGIRLGLWALWQAFLRLLRRIFRRRPRDQAS